MLVSMAYPAIYIQELGILEQSGEWVSKFGERLFIISGRKAWQAAGAKLTEGLGRSGLTYEICFFEGTCTYEEADRIETCIPPDTQALIAVGGGQCMDTAKLTGIRKGLPMITVPTLASTCAAVTPLSVMYAAGHKFIRSEYFDRCPVLTLVDPDIIANAPYRYLAAGIGDTIAKWYEANPINEGKFLNAKTRLGLQTAELARDLLLEFSQQAIEECKKGQVGEAIRQVIDTNILLAGLVGGIGHYTCRGSGAHSFHDGMTNLEEIHDAYHGEIVAFGILCQLMLEHKPVQEALKLIEFYRKVGLPASLSQLGVSSFREEEIRAIVPKICEPTETIHYLPFPIVEEEVYQAIRAAHELGESVLDGD